MIFRKIIAHIQLFNSIRNSETANGHGGDTPLIKKFGTGVRSGRNPQIHRIARHYYNTSQRRLIQYRTCNRDIVENHNDRTNSKIGANDG